MTAFDYAKEVTILGNEMWLHFDGSYDNEGCFEISKYEVWDDEKCEGYNYNFDEAYYAHTCPITGEKGFSNVMYGVVAKMEERMNEIYEPDDGADEAYERMRDLRDGLCG